MSKTYPPRICPECGTEFEPMTKTQKFDRPYCRVKFNRRLHKDEIKPLDSSGLLEEIRRVDVEIAADIEDIARRAGIQIAEQILLVCWKAMNRGATRQAKAVLIESGQVKPVKRRAKKGEKS